MLAEVVPAMALPLAVTMGEKRQGNTWSSRAQSWGSPAPLGGGQVVREGDFVPYKLAMIK